MSLTAHIVLKDLSRQRWALLLWLLMLLGQAAIAVHALAEPAQRIRMLTDWEPTILIAIVTAGILGLVVLGTIQEDTALGSRSFWMTRPISPGRLLRAKLAFVVTLVAVQAAIRVGVFAWAGLGTGDLFLAGAEELLEGGAFALVVAAFAVISPNALSFAIRTAAIVASALVGALVVGAVDYGFSPIGDPRGHIASMLIFVFVASGLLGLGVVATQLLARHRSQLLPLAVFTATFAIISTGLMWPWNFFAGSPGEAVAAAPANGPAATIAFPMEGNRLVARTARIRGRTGPTWLGAHLPNVRMADGSIVIPFGPESGELRWGDRVLPIRGQDGGIGFPGPYLGQPADILSLADVAAVAAAPLKLLGPAEAPRIVNLLPIQPAELERRQQEPARLRATVVGMHVAPVASEPLVAGRGFVRQPDCMQVAVSARWSGTAMKRDDRSGPTSVDGERFEVQVQAYRSLFQGNPASRAIGLEFVRYDRRQDVAQYLVVNRLSGEAVIPGAEDSGQVQVGGLRRHSLQLVVPIEQPMRLPSPLAKVSRVPNPAWFESAELVRVTLRSSGMVRGEVAADAVTVDRTP